MFEFSSRSPYVGGEGGLALRLGVDLVGEEIVLLVAGRGGLGDHGVGNLRRGRDQVRRTDEGVATRHPEEIQNEEVLLRLGFSSRGSGGG